VSVGPRQRQVQQNEIGYSTYFMVTTAIGIPGLLPLVKGQIRG